MPASDQRILSAPGQVLLLKWRPLTGQKRPPRERPRWPEPPPACGASPATLRFRKLMQPVIRWLWPHNPPQVAAEPRPPHGLAGAQPGAGGRAAQASDVTSVPLRRGPQAWLMATLLLCREVRG